MSVQRLLREADVDKIDEYLRLVRAHPYDPDKAEMSEMIIEQGMSAYQAAKRQSEFTNEKRSFKTLYYHAQMVVEDIYTFFGEPIDELAEIAIREGFVICDKDRRSELKQALDDSGVEYVEEVLIRVKGVRR